MSFTPAGGRIAVEIDHQDGWVIAEVRDTGIGIKPLDLPRIFDPFFRADKARSVDTGGTGLGLAIAHRIIVAHGGRIEVESTPGEGSVFRVWLPLARQLEARQ
jgi:signal transduction histidine kinase